MTSTEWEQGSVLDVSADGAAAEAVSRHVPQLVQQGVASALSRQDSSLWGEAARSEASIRLAWVGLHETSRELVPTSAAASVTTTSSVVSFMSFFFSPFSSIT